MTVAELDARGHTVSWHTVALELNPEALIGKALSTILSSPQHAILNSSIFLPDENRDGSRREGAGQGEQHQEAAIHVHSDHNIGEAQMLPDPH
eukprot:1154139-Pelagomonas_calceolata.AAC.1